MEDMKFSNINIEKLKSKILECYNLNENVEIKLLKYSENLTYLLSFSEKPKYVLRIFRPGYHQKAEMLGELIWIHQIKKDTDILTADVIKGKNNEFICEFTYEDNSYCCALFEYLKGKNIRYLSGNELYHYMEKIGEITAKLHNQVINWDKASSIDRFSWDFDDLVGENARWGDWQLMKNLPDEWMKYYREAVTISKRRLDRYGKDKSRYGLIHSDLNINNILVDEDKIKVLDFDDCGFGWFLYDLSTSVLEYFDETLENSLTALLNGYEKYRKLTKDEKDELETFIILRKIVRIGWIVTHCDNDTVKKVKPDYYEKTAIMAKRFCQKNG